MLGSEALKNNLTIYNTSKNEKVIELTKQIFSLPHPVLSLDFSKTYLLSGHNNASCLLSKPRIEEGFSVDQPSSKNVSLKLQYKHPQNTNANSRSGKFGKKDSYVNCVKFCPVAEDSAEKCSPRFFSLVNNSFYLWDTMEPNKYIYKEEVY